MVISCKNLIGLPVETKSGLFLGKIKNFDVDNETQAVLRYIVKSRSLIGKLLSEEISELIIAKEEVISLGEDKMVVQDGVVKESEAATLRKVASNDAPALSSRLSIAKSNDNRIQ